MLKRYPQFSFVFAIIFAFQLIADLNDLEWLVYISKPLITISLIIFIWKEIKHQGRFSKRIIGGLIFSLFGDVFLIFSGVNQLYFMAGLGAFLFAHLFYISAFFVDYHKKEQANKTYVWTAIIVFGTYCIGFYFYLRPHLGDLKIPVMIYAFVISLMAIMAVSRVNKVNTASFNLVLVGALFFVSSDSFLAYFKFVEPSEYSGLIVMSTYMIAQF